MERESADGLADVSYWSATGGRDREEAHQRFACASRTRPPAVGEIEVGGCPVLGFGWCQGDHAVQHHGERDRGRVYPVTLDRGADGGTVLRWSIPEWAEEE
ncbi:hypothetical protein ABZW10_15175 [Kitasatospora sp. NPDC004723]|uniref:hypothetical protein n=1 Tax=Kitasatospora sp. NPDC004723 TaxID=3154288 RepID=UPI0033B81442